MTAATRAVVGALFLAVGATEVEVEACRAKVAGDEVPLDPALVLAAARAALAAVRADAVAGGAQVCARCGTAVARLALADGGVAWKATDGREFPLYCPQALTTHRPLQHDVAILTGACVYCGADVVLERALGGDLGWSAAGTVHPWYCHQAVDRRHAVTDVPL